MKTLEQAIADWLEDPPRTYIRTDDIDDLSFTDYGYNVALAEIRSILRDPTGEHPTPDPVQAELEAARRARQP